MPVPPGHKAQIKLMIQSRRTLYHGFAKLSLFQVVVNARVVWDSGGLGFQSGYPLVLRGSQESKPPSPKATIYLKVKINGLPIPKGRLVKGPYKPICRDCADCAIYFSTTVALVDCWWLSKPALQSNILCFARLWRKKDISHLTEMIEWI